MDFESIGNMAAIRYCGDNKRHREERIYRYGMLPVIEALELAFEVFVKIHDKVVDSIEFDLRKVYGKEL